MDNDVQDNDTPLIHYGILRRSGRYPWGSGANPEERSRGFLGYIRDLEQKGLSEIEIATGLNITDDRGRPSISVLRQTKAIAKNEVRKADTAQALRLKSKGLSNVAVGSRMGIPESSVRSLIDPALKDKAEILQTTADLLKSKIADGGYLDIGAGTENHLSISQTKLATAVALLREEGYAVHNIQVAQLGTGQKTTVKVLAPPGTTYKDIVRNPEAIKTVAAYSDDGGRSYNEIEPPTNISSSRLAVVYAEDGGTKADGVIYLRPGVPELSLGAARYAQVRIAVDGTHYLKGMAMYKAGMPEGTDLEFHTSKSSTGNKLDALKPQKDELNPFGASIHQREYTDSNGKEKLSPINIVNEEGDWAKWSRNLSSQFLSKQPVELAKRQLDLALTTRRQELDEIRSLTNPVVRQKLLEEFADTADSAAVHLQAAALPRQTTKVILPFPSLKEHEVYAPDYNNGEKVVLVRHPHGGTFELPEVTVNNRNAAARAALGTDARDAIGIHPKVAERLSGADFDGDHVIVIPNNRGDVKTSPALKALKDFEPRQQYAPYDGMHTIDGGIYNAKTHEVEYGTKADGTPKQPSGKAKQQLMGEVSNLITDMSIKGATHDELAAAVRHSMVVIDAEKHALNYKQSYVDNRIASLKERYQGRGTTGRLSGASTIVSRAGSEVRVADRRARSAAKGGPVDTTTGAKVYELTGKSYVDKSGRLVVKTTSSTKLAETADARSLLSDHPMPIEEVYAAHSNSLKALANEARKDSLTSGRVERSSTATDVYASEVKSLNAKLNLALKNQPRERQAQLIANAIYAAKKEANPGLSSADKKKIKGQALETARVRVGARKPKIEITPEEWKAIQAGAISTNKLRQILANANAEKVRKLATPRAATVMTASKIAIAKARLASGYTQAEVAQSLGVPVSTLNSALLRGGG